MRISGITSADSERFDRRYEIKSDKECWNWTGGKKKDGYGKFNFDGVTIQAHRFAFARHYGPIEKHEKVLHHCDNSSCVNPHHLFIGTHKDNMEDRKEKSRRIKQMIPGFWK